MAAFNVVRFRVKPGNEQRFVDAHRTMKPDLKGFLGGTLVKTGDQTFCFVGEWRNFQSIVAARSQMIALLDDFRGMLEDLGGGLGVTDPVSGEVVVKVGAKPVKKAPARKGKAKKAAKSSGKAKKAKRAAKKR
jgi:Antibiotic biosynthesis monooxygenase